MPHSVYNRAKAGFIDGTEDWDGLTYKVTLVSNSYAHDPAHDFLSVLSGHELTGSNHTAGFGGTIRKTLTGTTVVQNNTDNRSECHAANVTWTAIAAGVLAGAVVVREISDDDDSVLVAFLSAAGGSFSTVGTNVAVSWHSAGLFGISPFVGGFEQDAFEDDAFEI